MTKAVERFDEEPGAREQPAKAANEELITINISMSDSSGYLDLDTLSSTSISEDSNELFTDSDGLACTDDLIFISGSEGDVFDVTPALKNGNQSTHSKGPSYGYFGSPANSESEIDESMASKSTPDNLMLEYTSASIAAGLGFNWLNFLCNLSPLFPQSVPTPLPPIEETNDILPSKQSVNEEDDISDKFSDSSCHSESTADSITNENTIDLFVAKMARFETLEDTDPQMSTKKTNQAQPSAVQSSTAKTETEINFNALLNPLSSLVNPCKIIPLALDKPSVDLLDTDPRNDLPDNISQDRKDLSPIFEGNDASGQDLSPILEGNEEEHSPHHKDLMKVAGIFDGHVADIIHNSPSAKVHVANDSLDLNKLPEETISDSERASKFRQPTEMQDLVTNISDIPANRRFGKADINKSSARRIKSVPIQPSASILLDTDVGIPQENVRRRSLGVTSPRISRKPRLETIHADAESEVDTDITFPNSKLSNTTRFDLNPSIIESESEKDKGKKPTKQKMSLIAKVKHKVKSVKHAVSKKVPKNNEPTVDGRRKPIISDLRPKLPSPPQGKSSSNVASPITNTNPNERRGSNISNESNPSVVSPLTARTGHGTESVSGIRSPNVNKTQRRYSDQSYERNTEDNNRHLNQSGMRRASDYELVTQTGSRRVSDHELLSKTGSRRVSDHELLSKTGSRRVSDYELLSKTGSRRVSDHDVLSETEKIDHELHKYSGIRLQNDHKKWGYTRQRGMLMEHESTLDGDKHLSYRSEGDLYNLIPHHQYQNGSVHSLNSHSSPKIGVDIASRPGIVPDKLSLRSTSSIESASLFSANSAQNLNSPMYAGFPSSEFGERQFGHYSDITRRVSDSYINKSWTMEHETSLGYPGSRGAAMRRCSSAATMQRVPYSQGIPFLMERETSFDGVKRSPVSLRMHDEQTAIEQRSAMLR